MWSSCPWVMMTASILSFQADRKVVSGRIFCIPKSVKLQWEQRELQCWCPWPDAAAETDPGYMKAEALQVLSSKAGCTRTGSFLGEHIDAACSSHCEWFPSGSSKPRPRSVHLGSSRQRCWTVSKDPGWLVAASGKHALIAAESGMQQGWEVPVSSTHSGNMRPASIRM